MQGRCLNPGLIPAAELQAYADGEATPRVAAHIGLCVACAEEVQWLIWAQHRLRRALQRAACPSALTLGESALGLLAPGDRSALDAHLRDCPRCADELRLLRSAL